MTLRRLDHPAFLGFALLATAACSSDDHAPGFVSASGGAPSQSGGAGGVPSLAAGGVAQGPSSGGALQNGSGGGTSSGGTVGASAGGANTGGAIANAGGTTTTGSGGASQGGSRADAGAESDAGDAGDMGDASLGDSGPESSGPGDWGPGDYPPSLMDQTYLDITGVTGQAGNSRQYKVHVPPGYDPKKPAPVVFCIHGLAQNAVMFCVSGAAMNTKSDQAGFVLVMPNGYQNSWNAGTCCGGASTSKLDDVALFRAILAEVAKHVNVDYRRVYATGLSNGAYMSYRLACDAADIFAAVAPGAGAVGINDIGGGTNPTSDFTMCTPSSKVSILDMHGTSDPLIPYSLQAPSLAIFAKANGCNTSSVPAAAPPSGGDTACVSYTGCAGGAQVLGCSITGGGHCWFGSSDCGTGAGAIGAAFVGANSDTMMNTDAVWDFFSHSVKHAGP
ncbi:MAG TPA: PHB depolymerase family esterase [Polyangiaceae bacterium]|nr:PHB depolymerase family esterase [Polyangiaceae bacterium]